MNTALTLALLAALQNAPDDDPMRRKQWFSLDLYHLARTLPDPGKLVQVPLNPGLQLGYHRALFGEALTGGLSLQAGWQQFDRLFWAASAGSGFEGAFRTRTGFFSVLGVRLDYARAFTGGNNFVLEGGRYRQESDAGRSFLRVTLADLSLGYSPPPLRRFGVVPALRYAWMLELPLYSNHEATTWSYTQFGLSVSWMWR